MLSTLLISAFLLPAPAYAAGQPVDLSASSEVTSRLDEADNTVIAMEMWTEALAALYDRALFEGRVEQLSCLTEEQQALSTLVTKARKSRSSLRSALEHSHQAKAKRQLRKLGRARQSASSTYTSGVQCAALTATSPPIASDRQGGELELGVPKRSSVLRELRHDRW